MEWRIERFAVLDSTNDEAARRAARGEPAGLVVVAGAQRAGRGRRGRRWESPPGGLYLSAVLRPSLAPADAGRVPIAVGLAVARALEGLGLRPALQWPNDVLVGARKVAGILCEARSGADEVAWVVAGIGVNRRGSPQVAELGGCSLEEAGARVDEEALLGALLAQLRAAVHLAEADPEALAGAWSQRAPMLGREVEIVTSKGANRAQVLRLGLDGALEVAVAGGVHRVTDPDLVRLRGIY